MTKVGGITNYKLRITNAPFVIPNTVRNLAEKRKRFFAYALNDRER